MLPVEKYMTVIDSTPTSPWGFNLRPIVNIGKGCVCFLVDKEYDNVSEALIFTKFQGLQSVITSRSLLKLVAAACRRMFTSSVSGRSKFVK